MVTETPEPGPHYVPVVASTDTHGPWNCEFCAIPDHGNSYEDHPITEPCHHEADFEWDMTDPQSPTKVYSGAYIGSWAYEGSTSTGALEDAVDEEISNPPLTYLQIKMDAAFATIAPSSSYSPGHFTGGGDWFGTGTGTNAPATVTPEVWHWDVTPCMVEKIEFRKHKDVKELTMEVFSDAEFTDRIDILTLTLTTYRWFGPFAVQVANITTGECELDIVNSETGETNQCSSQYTPLQ